MKIILADQHNLVRAGLRRLLEETGLVEVVAEADEGQQLLSLIGQLRPDAIVCDLRLRGMSGMEALEQIRRHYPEVRAVVLTTQIDASSVRQALRHGVSAFVSKDADLSELALALKSVRRNQLYLSPAVSQSAIDSREVTRANGALALTPRQRQVVQLIGKGRSTKEIAALIGISVKTVETHRARLMQSLNLHGTQALMRFAVSNGFGAVDS